MKLKFRFSYGNILNFFLSELFLIIYNSFSLLLISIPVAVLYGKFEYTFRENYVIMKIITITMVLLFSLYVFFLTVILFLPKGVIINNSFIYVKRYMLNFSYVFRGFNDEIYIKDIIECKMYEGKRYYLDRTGPYAVFFFDWDSLVEIKTKNNRIYLIPLENSDEFIDEVNKRRAELQKDKN